MIGVGGSRGGCVVGFWMCFKVQSTGPAKLTPSASMASGHIKERVTEEMVIILQRQDSMWKHACSQGINSSGDKECQFNQRCFLWQRYPGARFSSQTSVSLLWLPEELEILLSALGPKSVILPVFFSWGGCDHASDTHAGQSLLAEWWKPLSSRKKCNWQGCNLSTGGWL